MRSQTYISPRDKTGVLKNKSTSISAHIVGIGITEILFIIVTLAFLIADYTLKTHGLSDTTDDFKYYVLFGAIFSSFL